MKYTMMTIAKYITDNLVAFGLASADDLETIEKSQDQFVDGGKKIIMRSLRNRPDTKRTAPFDNLLKSGVRGMQFELVLELELKTRAPEPHLDFYWNAVREMRDKVYSALAGTNGGGLTILRLDLTDLDNPTPAGEIQFEISDLSPLEDEVEDPEDSAVKSVFMTYIVRWWRPM